MLEVGSKRRKERYSLLFFTNRVIKNKKEIKSTSILPINDLEGSTFIAFSILQTFTFSFKFHLGVNSLVFLLLL